MTNKHFTSDWFSKPGDSLLGLMQRRNVAPRQLAATLEGGMEVLRGLLAGSVPVDCGTARSLAAEVGGTADFWLKRQASYERALDRAVQVISDTELEEWLARVPAPGGRARGRLSEARKRDELRRRLAFFSVNNMRAWNARYGCLRSVTQFRTSLSFLSDEGAVSLWLRQGELEAALVSARAWNPAVLHQKLDEFRKLSQIGRPARFLPKLKELCAEAGVALVVVRAPAGCRASGATRLVVPNKAMILLSFRFRADDQFWFSFFHEVGHLLLHEAQTFVDDEETVQDDLEREANEFASSCIIPADRQAEFERLKPDRDAIVRFSVSVGIAPGLTVGQMQHRRMIGHERLNMLKRRWTWEEIEAGLTSP